MYTRVYIDEVSRKRLQHGSNWYGAGGKEVELDMLISGSRYFARDIFIPRVILSVRRALGRIRESAGQ